MGEVHSGARASQSAARMSADACGSRRHGAGPSHGAGTVPRGRGPPTGQGSSHRAGSVPQGRGGSGSRGGRALPRGRDPHLRPAARYTTVATQRSRPEASAAPVARPRRTAAVGSVPARRQQPPEAHLLTAPAPVMLISPHLRHCFREEIFYREGFVYLYDELSSPGIKSSRSWSLKPDDMPRLRWYHPPCGGEPSRSPGQLGRRTSSSRCPARSRGPPCRRPGHRGRRWRRLLVVSPRGKELTRFAGLTLARVPGR
jgi:hypothetical protein